MTRETADVVVCGAGIAGVSAAYHLVVQHGIQDVVLVDELPPLSLTSDKSTECYRNWWPGPGDAMVRLMNRSIDLLETWADESGNAIQLNRRGYLFATADPQRIDDYLRISREAEANGAGPLRIHRGGSDDPDYVPAPAEGYHDLPTGADLFLDPGLIQRQFPYLADDTLGALHARRCGWFSGQQVGKLLLDRALSEGLRLVTGRVDRVDHDDRVRGVHVDMPDGELQVATDNFVVAAGPKLQEVVGLLGIELPIFCELHAKVSMADPNSAVPRQAPLVIWSDEQTLEWTEEERQLLAEDPEMAWLLEPMPVGVHVRPEGAEDSPIILILWTYHLDPVEPTFPPEFDTAVYPEVALRGLSRMIPALKPYIGRMPKPFVDGGYYVKTKENRLLAGPMPVEGAYVLGALSGYGLMSSPAAGELLAAHVAGTRLPDYAAWFRLERYQDPEYQRLLETWSDSGQL
jgi:glycine/D-amino acid oxidase-like deaminating enzyme